MYIFRIQDSNNNGCLLPKEKFKYRFPYDLDYQDYPRKNTHPDADTGTALQKAMYDKTITLESKYLFGCASIRDLYSWFSPVDIGYYELNGFYVHVYDVPREYIIFGSNQVAFDSDHVISKRKLSHKELRRWH